MSQERQAELQKSNNIAWRPDFVSESHDLYNSEPAQRQNQLDPEETEVDTYDPVTNQTGDPDETADERHGIGVRIALNVGIDTPLLVDDPRSLKGAKTKEQKARERGWGEVYYGSYRRLLEMCEQLLNTPFRPQGGSSLYWERNVIGVDPQTWRAHAEPPLQPITLEDFVSAVKGTWFPVHAMGYNWLRSNRESGMVIAKRIKSLISLYKYNGYQCEKVIVVTHSMGGLVGRALVHPKIGNIASEILGVIHGVMPATGAPAAYKRMRCGFDGSGVATKVLGDDGPKVTAVLANSLGGLELLPSKAYGNGWLQIIRNRELQAALPKHGDPYDEIYKVTDKWYGLLQPAWINPAEHEASSVDRTIDYLDKARKFHEDINETYHKPSYAHYGADQSRLSWETVRWEIGPDYSGTDWSKLRTVGDNCKGLLSAVNDQVPRVNQKAISIKLLSPVGAGDETVPLRSAEHQLQSNKFSGVFRQIGYEHQASYSDLAALHSTLYSLVRIAGTMKWGGK